MIYILNTFWFFFFNLGTPSLCNEVLHTALDVVRALPPLSLSNESKIPQLGLDSLQEVTRFLKLVTLPTSNTDRTGKCLASELLLGTIIEISSDMINRFCNASCQ